MLRQNGPSVNLVLVQPQLRLADGEANLPILRARLDAANVQFRPDDVLLLPEGFHRGESREDYEADVCGLAADLGCHVVGGSHREHRCSHWFNCGSVADPHGRVIGRYEKLRPYADERREVEPGSALGQLEIAGRTVLVLICADFWFTDLIFRAVEVPDLILVPALSVTRKPTPEYSRALWRHLAVARAYELATYVGISDWGHPSELPVRFSSGVGGFADPTATEPEHLFSPIGSSDVRVYPIDFDALAAFRVERDARGFLRRPDSTLAASARE
jgi:predicted amidohydrolase